MNYQDKTKEKLIKVLQELPLNSNKWKRRLTREEFLMNALMDNLPDHIYFKDLKSRFIRINKSHAHFFGLDDPDLVIGKSDFDFFP